MRRVGAPRPPALGTRAQFFFPETGGAQHHEILRRERIRPAQRAHGDVLRGPRTDARQLGEALDLFFDVPGITED